VLQNTIGKDREELRSEPGLQQEGIQINSVWTSLLKSSIYSWSFALCQYANTHTGTKPQARYAKAKLCPQNLVDLLTLHWLYFIYGNLSERTGWLLNCISFQWIDHWRVWKD